MTYTCTFRCFPEHCWGVAVLHHYEIQSFCASISAWFLTSHLHPFIFSVKKKQKGKFLEEIFFVFKQPNEIIYHGNLQSCIWRSRVNTTFTFTVNGCACLQTVLCLFSCGSQDWITAPLSDSVWITGPVFLCAKLPLLSLLHGSFLKEKNNIIHFITTTVI